MKRTLAIALVGAVFLVGACGDDDDTETGTGSASAPTESESTTTAGGDGEQAAGGDEFCTAYQELLAGDPSPEQIRSVAEIAPEDAKEPLETIAAGFEEDPEGFFETEDFSRAFSEVGGVAADECADEVIEVTAIDYGFEGLPEDISAGTLGVEFSNEGNEFHEMVVFRKNDDTTQSFDEIFGLGEEEAQALVTEAGGTFAPPGTSSSGLFELAEPGEYVAVCFIPVGSTPDAEDSSGPPHFTQGMKAEFTVS